MKANGVQVQMNCSLYFFFKKHYCPKCQTRLERKKRAKIVDSFSEEAKNYDFSFGGDHFLIGDIKFITYYFACPACKSKYEIPRLKKLEKEAKRKKREERRKK